jgi:hypothetical protein
MNRRFFINSLAATLLGLIGIKRAAALPSTNGIPGIPVVKNTLSKPSDQPIKKLQPGDVSFEAKALMFFMLGGTQIFQDNANKTHYWIDDLFPASGKPDYSRFTNLGVNSQFLDNFLTKTVANSTVKPTDIVKAFHASADLWNQLFGYSGPECPNHQSLAAIVTISNKQ